MMQHLPLAAILVPLVTGALLLLLERRHEVRVLRIGAWIGMAALLLVSIGLVMRASQGGIDVYLLGDWPSRLGIVLMLGCLGYLVDVFGALLAPGYADSIIARYVMLPASIGEIGACLWLLLFGVRVPREG